jgi:ribosome maturation factor RimP
MTSPSERVTRAVAPAVAAAGLDLEDVQVAAAGRRRVVTVVVDTEGGVALDSLAAVSQALSDALDSSDALGAQPYVLEVTSPGVDRPLTQPRHWRRNIGRLVEVTLADGSRVAARIEAVDDAGVEVVVERQTTKGARVTHTPRRLDFAEIASAVVQVEFNRAADEAADEEDEDRGH